MLPMVKKITKIQTCQIVLFSSKTTILNHFVSLQTVCYCEENLCEEIEITYHTCAIITLGSYIFYPIFEDHFFLSKEVFSQNSFLMYG